MRLGLHRHTGHADTAFMSYVQAVRPPMVKMLDPGADAEALARLCVGLGTQVIGRNVFDAEGEQATGGNALGSAINRVVSLARACPSIKYWELFNEAFDEPGNMARYAEASILFMLAMEEQGRKAVIGCFSQGTPEVAGPNPTQEWAEYLPALRHCVARGHVLGLHEYSGPYMNWEETWHTLRYRRSLAIMKQLGLDVSRLKIAITESGIDDVWGRPGPLGKGYKPFHGTEWDRPPASVHGDYAGQLLWYGQELSKDPQIVGWVDFGWADLSGPGQDGRTKWADFDLSTDPNMLARVTALQKHLPAWPTPIPPPQEPTMTFDQQLLEEAARRQVVQLQPDAALQKAVQAAGFWPTSPEYRQQTGAKGLVMAMRAEHPATGEVRVYWVPWGKWDQVAYVRRGGATPAPGPAPGPSGAYRLVPGSYTEHRWPRPTNVAIQWIILHDPVGSTVDGTLAFLRQNAGEVAYHEMIAPNGDTYILAPPEQWVGHAGVATRINQYENLEVNHRTYGVCLFKAASDGGPFPAGQVAAAVARVADLIKLHGLPDAGVVLAHREVNTEPGRRSDPRGLDMPTFRAAVQARLDS